MVQRKQPDLKITEFGNPILRQKAKKLNVAEIKSSNTKKLINQMEQILLNKKLGVGLASPQVGVSLQIAIIRIRPSKHRDNIKEFDLNIINPKIIETFGVRQQQWEGCISGGSLKSSLFAKALRYKKLKLEFYNEKGQKKTEEFDGLKAQVIQHEVDHLNGVLFVDRVKDSKSFTTYNEYIKLVRVKTKKTS